VQANAKDEESVCKAVEESVKKFGAINSLIANHATFTSEDGTWFYTFLY
jgi:hypothetical protein